MFQIPGVWEFLKHFFCSLKLTSVWIFDIADAREYSVLCILHKTSFTFLFIWSDGQLSVNCSERVLSLLNAVLSLGRVFWAVLQCWDGDRGLERSRVLRGPSCQLSSIPSASSLLVSAHPIIPFLSGPVSKIASASVCNYRQLSDSARTYVCQV